MEYYSVTSSYQRLGRMGNWVNGVLYDPADLGKASNIGVVVMHSDGDYLNFPAGRELAKRGYRTLCANTNPRPLDKKLPDVNEAVNFVRSLEGIDKVVILGHSGGATLMSCYQAVAENGCAVFQGPEKIVPCCDLPAMTPADGVMLIDSNFGNGAMTLLSVDPAVIDDEDGLKLDPAYDLAKAEGYDPNGSTYTDAFVKAYQKAQGERNNRLIDKALARLKAIERGEGKFVDDEPFVAAGASQMGPCNRLFPQDIHYIAHTKGEWPLLHADGSVTTQVVPTVRRGKPAQPFSTKLDMGAVNTTVRNYLASRVVRALPDYGYDATGVYGIDWDSSFCCTPGNVRHVTAPMLIMGMTAGYEFVAAELIYEKAAATDKTLAFVEGATHVFTPGTDCEAFPGQFGDTMKTLFDYVAAWLAAGHI